MSKTWGNAIWIDDNPNDMYAKAMAINDDLIIEYFTLATNLSLGEISKFESELKKGENPINVKKKLAHHIVTELYDAKSAAEAAENFKMIVQDKQLPKEIDLFPVGDFNQTVFEIASDWAGLSNSELKRLIQQKGVEVNGNKIDMEGSNQKVKTEMTIKIGNTRIVKIVKK